MMPHLLRRISRLEREARSNHTSSLPQVHQTMPAPAYALLQILKNCVDQNLCLLVGTEVESARVLGATRPRTYAGAPCTGSASESTTVAHRNVLCRLHRSMRNKGFEYADKIPSLGMGVKRLRDSQVDFPRGPADLGADGIEDLIAPPRRSTPALYAGNPCLGLLIRSSDIPSSSRRELLGPLKSPLKEFRQSAITNGNTPTFSHLSRWRHCNAVIIISIPGNRSVMRQVLYQDPILRDGIASSSRFIAH
jgi:hypothetical protein